MDEQLLGELRKWLELPRVSVINPKQAKQLIGTVKALQAVSPDAKHGDILPAERQGSFRRRVPGCVHGQHY